MLLTEQEYTEVKSRAGLIPLSRWFKSLAIPREEDGPSTVQAEPERDGVPGVRKGGKVRVAGRGANATVGASSGVSPKIGVPNPKLCVNCDHLKIKHGGFKGACQVENCMCGGFE